MIDAQRHAEKLLGARHLVTNEAAFPGYRRATEQGWWTVLSVEPAWGGIIGAHEAHAGRPEDGFLVMENGILKFDSDSRLLWIPYSSIQRPLVEHLSKSPVSTSIGVLTDHGEVVFEFPCGGAFTFARFIRKVAGG